MGEYLRLFGGRGGIKTFVLSDRGWLITQREQQSVINSHTVKVPARR